MARCPQHGRVKRRSVRVADSDDDLERIDHPNDARPEDSPMPRNIKEVPDGR